MVGRHIDEDEERRFAALALDQPQGLVEVEPVGLHVARRAHLLEVDEVLEPVSVWNCGAPRKAP